VLVDTRSIRRATAGAAAASLIAGSGCADRRIGDALAAGCRPPAHESGLLAAYRSDSAFAIRPPEAVAVGPATVEKACIAVGPYGSVRRGVHAPSDAPPGATAAEVSASFALNVGFTQAQLTAMYDPGLQATGWAPQRLDLAPLNTGEQHAGPYYCKLVNHVPSFLSVYESYIGTADRRANESVSAR
jgi:hypothetical protein